MEELYNRKRSSSKLATLIGAVGGAGTGYVIAQPGALAYAVISETINLASGKPPHDVSYLLTVYAGITTASAGIGAISGAIFTRKIWNMFYSLFKRR